MRHRENTPALRALARLYGIQTSYHDIAGRRVWAPDETLTLLLRSLGIAVQTASDCRDAARAERLRQCQQLTEPVLIAWDGHLLPFEVRVPLNAPSAPYFTLTTEEGVSSELNHRSIAILQTGHAQCEGRNYSVLQVHVRTVLPTGYHTLQCDAGDKSGYAHVFSAPARVYRQSEASRQWGLFMPLYALRTASDWGAGSYSDLGRLVEWAEREGSRLVGTLPLLPNFHRSANDISPYLPITRLLWSEFYVDPHAAPNIHECPEALELLQSREVAEVTEALRRSPLVDYAETWRLKRRVLAALARHAWSDEGTLRECLAAFLQGRADVSDYAAFRAVADSQSRPWHEWQAPASDGDLSQTQVDQDIARFYQYAQWLAELQMSSSTPGKPAGPSGLYLDLPLGVHPDGYDAWRYREGFLPAASCGAPPDLLFTTGQDWGSPPPHPDIIRRRGYDYLRSVLAHHMRAATTLRIDHVMGLHHVFCIPTGLTSAHGTYIRYHPDEMYAVLSIESHRHQSTLIGEDLGTVPREVRRKMRQHGMNRMFVMHYELEGLPPGRRLRVPKDCLATLNTHDMPPFASMWRGLDIHQQVNLGIIREDGIPVAARKREKLRESLLSLLSSPTRGETADVLDVLRCTLAWLGASQARYVLLNLEDLWLETHQPNIPGIGSAYPSWRHRAAITMEQISSSTHIRELVQIVQRARNNCAGRGSE